MRRFFIRTSLGEEMVIRDQNVHHIHNVLRLQAGDLITVLDPEGRAGIAEIKECTADVVRLALQGILEETKEAPLSIYLVQGLPKSDKMDYIIQKAVELGVTAIYPVQTDRSMVRYDAAKKVSRRERWQKISEEAAKQCGRSLVPSIEPIQNYVDLFSRIPPEAIVLMLYEGTAEQGLKQVLKANPGKTYFLLVGPEGGFSDEEVMKAQKQGSVITTIGPRILRTETASLAAIAMVMYEYGDMGG